MSDITTTNGLVTELNKITVTKLQYQCNLNELELELAESDLLARINKGKALIAELNKQETELKNKWIEILQTAWIDKFESNWTEVRIKTTAWSLKIDDEEKLDDCYKKTVTKTTTSIDKNEIKKDMKEWVIIEWVTLEKKVTLEIKQK